MRRYRVGMEDFSSLVIEQKPAGGTRLVAMATSAADAENLCEAMNWAHRLAAANGREIVDIVEEIRGRGRETPPCST